MVERATITVPDENLLPLFEQHFETNGLTSESMSRVDSRTVGSAGCLRYWPTISRTSPPDISPSSCVIRTYRNG